MIIKIDEQKIHTMWFYIGWDDVRAMIIEQLECRLNRTLTGIEKAGLKIDIERLTEGSPPYPVHKWKIKGSFHIEGDSK